MPTYSYRCSSVLPYFVGAFGYGQLVGVPCNQITDVFLTSISRRVEPQVCATCGGVAEYDANATLQGASPLVVMDYNSYLHKKFGRNPNWHPPRSNAGRNDMESVGEERLRQMKAMAQSQLNSGNLTPAEESAAAAMVREPIKSRPKTWGGHRQGAKMSYPGSGG